MFIMYFFGQSANATGATRYLCFGKLKIYWRSVRFGKFVVNSCDEMFLVYSEFFQAYFVFKKSKYLDIWAFSTFYRAPLSGN